jgi:hypothetical protein
VQHHGVVNSEILDLAFIAFWNQTPGGILNANFTVKMCHHPTLTMPESHIPEHKYLLKKHLNLNSTFLKEGTKSCRGEA